MPPTPLRSELREKMLSKLLHSQEMDIVETKAHAIEKLGETPLSLQDLPLGPHQKVAVLQWLQAQAQSWVKTLQGPPLPSISIHTENWKEAENELLKTLKNALTPQKT